jgi:hypothetical protein
MRSWAKDSKRHFTKENIPVANKHVQRCLTYITEVQIKTTVRYQYTFIRIDKIKKKKPANTKFW